MSAAAALDLTLRGQAEAVAGGDVDAADLLEACLERIEERNGELNAVVATFPEESRRMLDAAPAGPLRGVPVVIKDEWPLPWRAQRFGSAWTPVEMRPGESGPYRALRDAGAVIVGVGNMHELGTGSTGAISAYGPAHNPWDVSRCAGGSSSGPAASVAGGLVAGAVGADGLGSIRYPAAYCGLTGLKPTFGRSAMEGHHMRGTKMIVSGALCADAADCRLLDSALFGEPLSASEPEGITVGVVRDPFWSDSAPGVAEACEAGLAALTEGPGVAVREVEVPGFELATAAAVLVAQAEEAEHLTPAALNGIGEEELSIINRAVLKFRALIPTTLTARADLVRTQFRRTLAGAFEEVDALAWPTVPAPAPPLENPTVELPSGPRGADPANALHGAFANMVGVPSISVPVGLTDGLPAALQLTAAWGRDELLLDLAEAIERASDREHVERRAPVPV